MSAVYIYKPLNVQAIREGADAVIAVGGDGTLHEVQFVSLSNNMCISIIYAFECIFISATP